MADMVKLTILIIVLMLLVTIELIWRPSIDVVRNRVLLWHGRKQKKYIVLYDPRWFE